MSRERGFPLVRLMSYRDLEWAGRSSVFRHAAVPVFATGELTNGK